MNLAYHIYCSASPFEAMAEPCNWLRDSISSDPFGQSALAADISEGTL